MQALQADEAAAGLIGLGIEPGDRIAMLSENRYEWLIADHADVPEGNLLVEVLFVKHLCEVFGFELPPVPEPEPEVEPEPEPADVPKPEKEQQEEPGEGGDWVPVGGAGDHPSV